MLGLRFPQLTKFIEKNIDPEMIHNILDFSKSAPKLKKDQILQLKNIKRINKSQSYDKLLKEAFGENIQSRNILDVIQLLQKVYETKEYTHLVKYIKNIKSFEEEFDQDSNVKITILAKHKEDYLFLASSYDINEKENCRFHLKECNQIITHYPIVTGDALIKGYQLQFSYSFNFLIDFPDLNNIDLTNRMQVLFYKNHPIHNQSYYSILTRLKHKNLKEPLFVIYDISNSYVEKKLIQSIFLYGKVLGAAIIVSIIIISVFLSSITKKIRLIVDVINQLVRKEFTARTHLKGKDEISYLGTSIDYLAQYFDNYQSKINNLFVSAQKSVPKDLFKLFSKKDISEIGLGNAVEKELTLIYSDLEEYISLTTAFSPEKKLESINNYYKDISPIIKKSNGILDNFSIEGYITLFKDSTDSAIQSALDIIQKINEENRKRFNEENLQIPLYMGIHSGKVTIGTIGFENRMEGVIIGADVQLAKRVQGIAKIYKSQLIITEYSYQKILFRNSFNLRFIDQLPIKNTKQNMRLYEVFNHLNEDEIEKRLNTKLEFEKAVLLFYEKDFKNAKIKFLECLNQNPDDNIIKVYLKRLQKMN